MKKKPPRHVPPPREGALARSVTVPWGVWVGLLAALHLLCAAAYWHLVPFGQGPDEESHLLFIQTLAGEQPAAGGWAWGLPVLATDAGDPNFEVHQPPLYYGLGAVAWRLGGLTAVRLLSLACGALLVLVTAWLVAAVAGEDLALAVAAVVALLPMQGFLASRVNNDPLVNVLWAIACWRWVVTLRDGPSRREGWLTGLVVGAALLTKQSSLGLVALAVLLVPLSARRAARWRAAAEQAALTLTVAALLAGWWYLRNRAVYGDLFAQQAFDLRFLSTRPTPTSLARDFAAAGRQLAYWPYVFDWVVRTSVIYIGHGFLRLPKAVYPVQLALILLTGTCSVVVWALRWRRTGWSAGVATGALLGAGLVVTLAFLARLNATYFQAQGRYLFLMLPGWALLLCAGPSRLWPPGSWPRRYLLLVAPLWCGLLNGVMLTVYLPGLFEVGP